MLKNSSKITLVPRSAIAKTLRTPPTKGKKLLEPLFSISRENHLPINILESKKVLEGDAETHKFEGDLWHCLEGSITFACGGKLIRPTKARDASGNTVPGELKAKSIKGGKKITLKKGDWLWIPQCVPHQHTTKTLARLLIIKIPARG